MTWRRFSCLRLNLHPERQQLTSSNDPNDLPGNELSSSVTQRTCPLVRSSAAIRRNLLSRRSFARSRPPALVRSSTQCEIPKDGDADRGKEHSVDCDSFKNQLTIKENRSKGRWLQRSKTFESISSFLQRRTEDNRTRQHEANERPKPWSQTNGFEFIGRGQTSKAVGFEGQLDSLLAFGLRQLQTNRSLTQGRPEVTRERLKGHRKPTHGQLRLRSGFRKNTTRVRLKDASKSKQNERKSAKRDDQTTR